uniref:Putative secreted protein n=1 Tax=Anopheles darlingi TaxID=43151 RepID=A0A2M4DAR4_ANODA
MRRRCCTSRGQMWVVMVVTVMLWLPFGRHYSHAARTQGAARKGMAGRMMLHHTSSRHDPAAAADRTTDRTVRYRCCDRHDHVRSDFDSRDCSGFHNDCFYCNHPDPRGRIVALNRRIAVLANNGHLFPYCHGTDDHCGDLARDRRRHHDEILGSTGKLSVEGAMHAYSTP